MINELPRSDVIGERGTMLCRSSNSQCEEGGFANFSRLGELCILRAVAVVGNMRFKYFSFIT